MTFLRWPKGPRKPVPPRPRRRRRPGVELLEDRRVPATFSNPIAITVPATGTVGIAASYPSHIVVSGLGGTVGKVTVTLNGFGHDFPDDVDVLLVAPSGANVTILSDVGGATPVSNLTLTLDDEAVSSLLEDGPLTSGTFKPTNFGEFHDPFPAPAPAPSGGARLAAFNGIGPNGTWSLFVVDDTVNQTGSIQGGWALNFQVVSFTTTAVRAAPNPVPFGQAVTLSATVTGPGTPTGTVTFQDGSTVLGTAPLDGGRASLVVPGLGPGTHAITAVYSGDDNFHGSTSAGLGLVVNDQITAVRFRRNGVAKVRVQAATTGAVRAVLTPFRGFGGRLALELRDINSDGVLDLVVRAVVHGKGKQKVFDAVTLAPLPLGLA